MIDPTEPATMVEVLEDLDDLHAAATRASSTIARATRRYSYTELTEGTGLSRATIQRWRIEHPTAVYLRAAETRRTMTTETYDTTEESYR